MRLAVALIILMMSLMLQSVFAEKMAPEEFDKKFESEEAELKDFTQLKPEDQLKVLDKPKGAEFLGENLGDVNELNKLDPKVKQKFLSTPEGEKFLKKRLKKEYDISMDGSPLTPDSKGDKRLGWEIAGDPPVLTTKNEGNFKLNVPLETLKGQSFRFLDGGGIRLNELDLLPSNQVLQQSYYPGGESTSRDVAIFYSDITAERKSGGLFGQDTWTFTNSMYPDPDKHKITIPADSIKGTSVRMRNDDTLEITAPQGNNKPFNMRTSFGTEKGETDVFTLPPTAKVVYSPEKPDTPAKYVINTNKKPATLDQPWFTSVASGGLISSDPMILNGDFEVAGGAWRRPIVEGDTPYKEQGAGLIKSITPTQVTYNNRNIKIPSGEVIRSYTPGRALWGYGFGPEKTLSKLVTGNAVVTALSNKQEPSLKWTVNPEGYYVLTSQSKEIIDWYKIQDGVNIKGDEVVSTESTLKATISNRGKILITQFGKNRDFDVNVEGDTVRATNFESTTGQKTGVVVAYSQTIEKPPKNRVVFITSYQEKMPAGLKKLFG